MQLANYKILDKLYESSTTLVYRGQRFSDRKPVVIKVMQNKHPNFDELAQFRNQYTIVKKINSSGILNYYGLENYGNSYALILEDYGGVSLKKWWLERYQNDGEQGVNQFQFLTDFFVITIQLAHVLHELHQHDIIHKDIKPSNILIHPVSQQVKLIDFSVASRAPKKKQALQTSNILEGTLPYISPEQTCRMNRGIDYRTDFYSLGITCYELLTGQLPFKAKEPMEWIYFHLAKNPLMVHEKNHHIPQSLSEIVCKLIAKNPEDRYQSALGLKYDLEQCLSQWKKDFKIYQFELGKQDICDHFIVSNKLYGRDLEVEILLDAFSNVTASSEQKNYQEILLISGAPGIGKTAIIQEIYKPIVHQRGYFIQGKFDQFQRDIPYSALLKAFRGLMKQFLTESHSLLEQRKADILETLGENAQVIIDVIPELELVIGSQPPVPQLSGIASQNRFNFLFKKLVQVLATEAHPLVIFIDDLQWADSASLKLIQLLTSETKVHYLFFIGAYRDNEVSSVHPLIKTLDKIEASGTVLHTILLDPLQFSDLNHCIADTLHCSVNAAQPITQLIYQTTQGNPFFSRQFLQSLYDDGLIYFNHHINQWEWDLEKIRTLSISKDVVEFMANKLKKMPLKTQELLQFAACIGNEFTLSDLATVCEQSSLKALDADLNSVLEQGLILRQDEGYRLHFNHQAVSDIPNWVQQDLNSISDSYQFLHDRVQQAAYSLIPEHQQQKIHLKIGRLFLGKLSDKAQEEKIFDIVNHFNVALDCITCELERYQLLHLNLKAAQKAIATTAYKMALNYAKIGIQLLPSNCWQVQYQLTLTLHEIVVEAAALENCFEFLDQMMKTVLVNAKKSCDCIKVYEIRIQAFASQGQVTEAIDLARKALQQFDVNFPDEIVPQDIQTALVQTTAKVVEQGLDNLRKLPELSDPQQLAIRRIILKMMPATLIAEPTLWLLAVSSQTEAAIDYGNSSDSAFFYAAYGSILVSLLQDFETASWLGELSLDLIERYDSKNIKSATYCALGAFIIHINSHLQETLPILEEGYQSGLESGNLEFVGYCVKDICRYSYFMGKELTYLVKETSNYIKLLERLHQNTTLNYCQICSDTILTLTGQKEWADKNDVLLKQLQQGNDAIGLFNFYLDQLVLSYLFGELSQAQENAQLSRQYLASNEGFFSIPVFYFYDSLLALAQYSNHSANSDELLKQVDENQEKLKRLAHYAPMNYLHKFYLIEAERCRVLEDKIQATEMYDQAITLSQEHQFINEVALANELAAKFYLSWGKEKIAQEYLMNAYSAYSSWGATAKVKCLEETYPDLIQLTKNVIVHKIDAHGISFSLSKSMGSTSSTSTQTLDLTTVLKASQTLAEEIHLEQLLEKLMHIITENAGAEKCMLLLKREEKWVVEAIRNQEGDQQVLQSFLLQNYENTAQSIINYVARTEETLVIQDASNDPIFAIDPYIIQSQPKSIICKPIHYRRQLIGLIYLENNLMPGAFTDNHLAVLNLLTTQIAISLENALLYADLTEANYTLEEKVQKRTEQLHHKNEEISQQNHILQETLVQLQQTQAQLIQAEKMSSLGQMVAGIAHEINNPVSFIHGNIMHANDYVQDLLNLIHTFQESYSVIPEAVQAQIEEIELEFIEADLPQLFNSMQVGTGRIRDIVKSLRNFSRLDESEWKAVDIHEGIESTLLILKNRLQATTHSPEITVIKDYGKLPLVHCYAGKLNQVFFNILSNAIDALFPPQPDQKPIPTQPEIRIQTITDQNSISIQISDNGSGMTEQVCSKVFDPFFTTKPVGQGTGLGLSVSYQIVVEKHQGCLTCQSTLGQGTTFRIEIPLGGCFN